MLRTREPSTLMSSITTPRSFRTLGKPRSNMCLLRRISLISSPRPSLMISTLPFANGLVCTPSTTQGLRGSVGMATAYFNRHSTYWMPIYGLLDIFIMTFYGWNKLSICDTMCQIVSCHFWTSRDSRSAQIGPDRANRAAPRAAPAQRFYFVVFTFVLFSINLYYLLFCFPTITLLF